MNYKLLLVGLLSALVAAVGTATYFSAATPPAAEPCTDPACNEEAVGHTEGDAHAAIVTLKDSAIREFGIELAQAKSGPIGIQTVLPAEIILNKDNMAHVLPRIPGVVQSIAKNLGDTVKAGETLAVIHSPALADYKAGYLAAKERLELAEALFEREKTLRDKNITAEQDYLKAKGDLADARIALRSAEQKLFALGFSKEHLAALPNNPEESYIVFTITAPIDGTVIEKHITLGESVQDNSELFTIANIRNVWVDVHIPQKDLAMIQPNQKAVVKTESCQGEGTVSYVSSIVADTTRTALCRIILPNDQGLWHPGTFATAEICTEEVDCAVIVSREAIVTLENETMIFIPDKEGFKLQPVEVGKSNSRYAEIRSGLQAGQSYVSKGVFTLKSELLKSGEDPCGGH